MDTERGKARVNVIFQLTLIQGLKFGMFKFCFFLHNPCDGQSVLLLRILQTIENPRAKPRSMCLLWLLVTSHHSPLMSFSSVPQNGSESPSLVLEQLVPALGGLDRSRREQARMLSQLSPPCRPPGRGGRRAGPSEIEFHKLQPWTLCSHNNDTG